MTNLLSLGLPLAIPSPSQSQWSLFGLPIRAYGLIIVTGIIIAAILTNRRYTRMGAPKDTTFDVVMWSVPIGIVGARLYHVFTSPAAYFGPNGRVLDALKIWEGGLGIIGGVVFGAITAFLWLRSRGLRLAPFADAVAPTLLLAQAIGRWGNYFNQELFGSPTTLPWGLRIDAAHMPPGYPPGTLFHPTFLYESLWNLAAAAVLLLLLERRLKMGNGQLFFSYVLLYGIGRFWMETLRIDTAEIILGLRINSWAAMILIAIGIAGVIWRSKAADNGSVYIEAQGK